MPSKSLTSKPPEGESLVYQDLEDRLIMCQSVLRDPAFFAFLFRIDLDHAVTVRLQGCSCGGPLHQANYARKPRGVCCAVAMQTTRMSFCCGDCRLRCTPASVRFLGRRVYWGALVVLATALCAGLSLRRGRQLSQQLGVPALTLMRWREWGLTTFTTTAVWQSLRGRLLPPVAISDLPGELLNRVLTNAPCDAMAMMMRWLAPLTTLTECR